MNTVPSRRTSKKAFELAAVAVASLALSVVTTGGAGAATRGGRSPLTEGRSASPATRTSCVAYAWEMVAPCTLEPGQSLTSLGGRYSLSMQRSDGNLVLRWLGKVVWASGTGGHSGARAVIQRDGNFVVYDGSRPLWTSGSGGHQLGSYDLFLNQDGDFVVTNEAVTSELYSSRTETKSIRTEEEPAPAYNGDGGDPSVVYYDKTYFLFTTGTALGNHIQVLVSGNPSSGYHCTGLGSGCKATPQYGSTALRRTPAWEQPNTSTSPTVFEVHGHWVLYYDASLAGHPADSGATCLSVATASQITPANPVFGDATKSPLECLSQYGGSLDPDGFVDPFNGVPYLIWKTNDGSSLDASHIWAVQLNSSGTAMVGSPRIILTNNTVQFPFDTTLDDPFMVYANGRWFLMFTVGDYQSSDYREAFATCSGPLGPCTQPAGNPFTSSYTGAYGPGGGSLFKDQFGDWWNVYAAWNSSVCQSYSCGAVRRDYVAPFDPGGPGD